MKHKIKEAIKTTLVIENKESINYCVDKIEKIVEMQMNELLVAAMMMPSTRIKHVCTNNIAQFVIDFLNKK